jgi:hypothetical protein
MTKTLSLFLLILLFARSQAKAQTVPIAKIDRFLCKFPVVGSQPQDSMGKDELPRLNLNAMAEWRLDSIGADGHGLYSSQLQLENGFEWLRLNQTDQDGVVRMFDTPDGKHAEYRYYILSDVGGYGSGEAVLTLWKRITTDSLKFICAEDGYFGGNLSMSSVQKAAQFPDGSVLVCVLESFGDAGDFYQTFSFLRGISQCELRPFLITSYDQNSNFELRYDFSHLSDSPYRVIETKLFVSYDSTGEYADNHRTVLDSSSAHVIDLWEIAKKKMSLK